MKPKTNRVLLALMALVALFAAFVAVACGGDNDDDDTMADDGHDHQEFKLGDLVVMDPWVRTTTTDVSAAYMTIESKGAADSLVAASSPIAGMVQLHEVITEGSSSKMQEKPGGFPVPANGTLELKPGGYHIMLMNLKSQPKEGETVQLELTFEKAGKLSITAPVKAASGQTPNMDHNHGSGMSGMASPTAGN